MLRPIARYVLNQTQTVWLFECQFWSCNTFCYLKGKLTWGLQYFLFPNIFNCVQACIQQQIQLYDWDREICEKLWKKKMPKTIWHYNWNDKLGHESITQYQISTKVVTVKSPDWISVQKVKNVFGDLSIWEEEVMLSEWHILET